jgi:cytochrome c551/c552
MIPAALATLLVLAGCTGKPKTEQPSTTTSGTSTAGTAGSAQSPLDQGPRAADTPADEALAERGEALFKDKGCSACHALGRKLTCPDLDGVTMRRTAKWMEQQILDPERMVKEDPISHQLFAQFSLQMPNQKLTPDEARAVIEYLKHENQESASKQGGTQ